MAPKVGHRFLLREINVTASFGVAATNPGEDRIEQLIDRADQALMFAKRAGRNRVARSSAMNSETTSGAAIGPQPPPKADRSHLIQNAQAIARCAAELSEIISSQVDDPLVTALERISKLKELVMNLSTNLQRHNVPPVLNLDISPLALGLNIQSEHRP